MDSLFHSEVQSAFAKWKEYLTLLGESTPTFENSAYIIGIVGTVSHLYISQAR